MKNLTITLEQYLKAIELGFYELIKDVSVFNKIVRHYKLSGGFDDVLITLKTNKMAGINFTDEREYAPKLTFKNTAQPKRVTVKSKKEYSHNNICHHCSEINDNFKFSSYCSRGCEIQENKHNSFDWN